MGNSATSMGTAAASAMEAAATTSAMMLAESGYRQYQAKSRTANQGPHTHHPRFKPSAATALWQASRKPDLLN
jgi:hypothetical protein